MGCGRLPAWTATIRPFADRPDVGLPVVFYAVPALNPDGPESPFVDRFWDNREHWIPPGPGMDPTSFRPYFGPVPGPAVGPLVGSPGEWAFGLSHAKWLAGGYSRPNGCVMTPAKSSPVRIRQQQSVRLFLPFSELEAVSPCPNTPVPTALLYVVRFSGVLVQNGPMFWDDTLGAWVSGIAASSPGGETARYVLTPSGATWTVTRDGVGWTIGPSTCLPFRVTAFLAPRNIVITPYT